jgi:hypothetical protein
LALTAHQDVSLLYGETWPVTDCEAGQKALGFAPSPVNRPLDGITSAGNWPLSQVRRTFYETPDSRDDEEAAHMSNRCRTRGIAGSAVDFLICAAAHRRGWA